METCSTIEREKNRAQLAVLATDLIERIEAADTRIEEGIVMTMSRVPYRRLDCGGRALCYVRVRPTKNVVRIDISGHWLLPEAVPADLRADSKKQALVVRGTQDLDRAAAFVA